jgi:hypothetical protein
MPPLVDMAENIPPNMMNNTNIIAFFSIISLSFVCFTHKASAQNHANGLAAKQTINNGYFEYVVEDNYVTTQKNYLAARESFRIEQPKSFKEFLKQTETTPETYVSTEKYYVDPVEFQSMPADKQKQILDHPERFEIGTAKPDSKP